MSLTKERHKELKDAYEFKRYVYSFYGKHKDGLYLQALGLDQDDINFWCDIYLSTHQFNYPKEYLAYDSIDRERVGMMMDEHVLRGE